MTRRRLGLATVEVPAPLENKMGNDIHQCGTQRGAREWSIDQADGASLKACKQVFAVLEDWNFLEKMDFLLPEEVRSDKHLVEDTLVAKYVWKLVRGTVQHELRTFSMYADRPTYGFSKSFFSF